MKAKDLIKILEVEPEREVIMSSDSEGNSYSPCSDVATASYRVDPNYNYEGNIGLEELTEDLANEGYTEDDVYADGTPAWILYPMN